MALMTRKETVEYHRSELARLQSAGCTDESLIEYHQDGTKIFEPVPFDREQSARLMRVINRQTGRELTIEDMERFHNEFYENEALLK